MSVHKRHCDKGSSLTLTRVDEAEFAEAEDEVGETTPNWERVSFCG